MGAPKELSGLDCDGEDRAGIQLVLRSRLDEMCELRVAALDWSDIEGVHDMRVASRRLRSALTDLSPYLRSRAFPKGPLKKIGKALGAVRDEDVAIAALEELTSKAEGLSDGIEQITHERRERQARARTALEKVITESALDKFREGFLERIDRLNKAPTEHSVKRKGEPRAGKTYRQIGIEVITDRANHLRNASGSLYHPHKTKPLHRTRILAKRLRYAIELFVPCWGDELAPFTKEAARLQASLGALHDCDVWIADIGSRLERIDKSKRAQSSPDYRAACVWLLRYFAKERAKHYDNALERWQQTEEAGFFTRLQTELELKSNGVESKSAEDPAGS